MARVQSTVASSASQPANSNNKSTTNNTSNNNNNNNHPETLSSRRKRALDRLVGLFRRLLVHNAVNPPATPTPTPPTPAEPVDQQSYTWVHMRQLEYWRTLDILRDKICRYCERVILWDDVRDSAVHVLAFNIFYWSIVVFQLRGLAAVGSAAAIMLLSSFVLSMDKVEQPADAFDAKVEQFEKVVKKLAWDLHTYFENLENTYPTVFAFGFPVFSLTLAAIVPLIGPMLLLYVALMSVFLAPPILLWCFGEQLSSTDQDGEISEFLPESTEDNLQVLSRACESGKQSPTPSNSNSAQADNSDDEDLEGLNMSSHEEGSTDGLDLSDIELGPGDTDTDGVPVKRRRFDHDASSSDSEPDYSGHRANDDAARHLDVDETDSSADSDFEIIDNRELEELRNV